MREGVSVKRASLQCRVPRSTLRDRISGRSKTIVRRGVGTILTHDDEKALVEHLKKLSGYGYGLTRKQVIYQYFYALKSTIVSGIMTIESNHIIDI